MKLYKKIEAADLWINYKVIMRTLFNKKNYV